MAIPIQQELPLSVLIHTCADEQRRQQEESAACFEILRRALEDHADAAWAAFDAQFGALLVYWIQQDAAQYGFSTLDREELADVRADGVARFIERYGADLSRHFPHIGAALKVLHKCLRSVIQERHRVRTRNTRLASALQQTLLEENRAGSQGDLSVLGQIELDELRRCIQTLLYQDVPEEHLQLLLELRFSLDLKPREIHAYAPDHFPSVGYVNDQLDRLFKRLRRRIEIYTQRCL